MQRFFEKHPAALVTGLIGRHAMWVIPRPRLPLPQKGGGVPDFLVCEWNSNGPKWSIVELENPNESPLKRKGVSAKCSEARDQIEQYRTYISRNSAFLRDNGFLGIQEMCDGYIVIGRRKDRNHEKVGLLQAFERANIEVLSYDRLFEHAQDFQEMLQSAMLRSK